MPITIENPTAEAFFAAFQQLPLVEIERFKQLITLEMPEPAEAEEDAWHRASANSAARFLHDEDEQL